MLFTVDVVDAGSKPFIGSCPSRTTFQEVSSIILAQKKMQPSFAKQYIISKMCNVSSCHLSVVLAQESLIFII